MEKRELEALQNDVADIKKHQKSFTNGWDLKSIMILLGLVFNLGYAYSNFENLSESFSEYKKDMKEIVREIRDLIATKADKTSDGNTK